MRVRRRQAINWPDAVPALLEKDDRARIFVRKEQRAWRKSDANARVTAIQQSVYIKRPCLFVPQGDHWINLHRPPCGNVARQQSYDAE